MEDIESQELEFYIGQKFYGVYPPEAAIWCNANNAMIVAKTEQQESEDGTVDVKYYEICAVPEPPAPTHDEIREMRANAYQQEVDPITSHITRLRDAEITEEIAAEIAELIAERDALVEEIKARYPYPDEQ